MTAFERKECRGEWGHAIWEIRSVNHRYLEINLHLPDDLRILTSAVREHVAQHIKRGKIDCTLRFDATGTVASELTINTELVKKLINACREVGSLIENAAPLNPLDLLRWPGVLDIGTPDSDLVGTPLLELLDTTLELLVETRQREGVILKSLIQERCEMARHVVASVRKKLPVIMVGLKEQLRSRAQELTIELPAERLEQEMLLLTQKLDVAEELDRLDTHLLETDRVLSADNPVGRRLDFLMQEMSREANTLGAKSAHVDCTNASVELKVLIEQMREQVQNIE
ncbi:MAG: YicC family protein [Gammaproteobacteria bacterium]|nr:YicC family protein [Gammaproteobacteria bacterium]